MARFSYLGIDIQGKTSSGEIVADDAKDARSKIKKAGLTPITVKSLGTSVKKVTKAKKVQSLTKKIAGHKKTSVSGKGEKIGLEFLKRLLELHSSGMPVADAVKLLINACQTQVKRKLLECFGRN